MAKSTKPRNDWDAIRLDYINGMSMKGISEKYNICYPDVLRKARQKGWGEHKSLITDYDNVAIKVASIVKEAAKKDPELRILQDKLHNNVLPSQIEQVDKDVAMMGLYKANLMRLQEKFAKVIEKSADQIEQILDTHKDGLYTSRIGADGSISYEPTNIHLKNLAPFFAENNKALGLTGTQVAVQNNVNTKEESTKDTVIIEIQGD